MQRLNPPTPSVVQDAQMMTSIANEFFPTHAPREPDEAIEIDEIPMISEAELKLAVDSLKSRKAPGSDGIAAEALKATVRACPQLLLDMFNGCLKQGDFCKQVKVQHLVLISKGNLNTAGAYKPLCMLDTAGKVLKRSLDLDYRAQSRLPGTCLTEDLDRGSQR